MTEHFNCRPRDGLAAIGLSLIDNKYNAIKTDLSGTIKLNLHFYLRVLNILKIEMSYLPDVAEPSLLSAKLSGRHVSSAWKVNVPLPASKRITRF